MTSKSMSQLQIIGTIRSLRFTVGWPLKSCTHTGIFPSVSGHPAVKRKPRKVPIIESTSWCQKVCPNLKKYVNTSTIMKSTGRQNICHKPNMPQHKKYTKKWVIPSKGTAWCERNVMTSTIMSKVRHDIKKYVMTSKVFHEVKSTSWC